MLFASFSVVQAQPPDAEETPEAREQRRGQVLARVGETQITVGMVEDSINTEQAFLRTRYQSPAALREYVETMVRDELLAQEARRRNLDEHPTVKRTVRQHAVQYLVRREFDQRVPPQSITEADIRDYYIAHEATYSRPEMVRASHILVASEELARELVPQARDADPRTFRQLVSQHSIDNETRLRGGDLRFFTREGRPPGSTDAPVDPALVEAAFALENRGDTVSEPIRVGENWSVLQLTNRRPAEQQTLEEMAESIRMILWRERRERAVDEFVDGLRQRFQPEVFPERIAPIVLDPAPPRPGLPPEGHVH